MDAGATQAFVQDFLEVGIAFRAVTVGPVAVGVHNKIGIIKIQTVIIKAHFLLLPLDHAIAMVVQDDHHKV